MAITSYPFDGTPTTEAQYSRLFRELRETGVCADVTAPDFSVVAEASDNDVRIKPGFAIVRGHAVHSDSDYVLNLTSPPAGGRYDLIYLRLDPVANSITIGATNGTSDTVPDPVQTDAGVYEFPLAYVRLTPGSPAQVTDLRHFSGQDVSAWRTARRPSNPRRGMLGYNIDSGEWEFWNGSSWENVFQQPTMLTHFEALTTAERDALSGEDRFVGRAIYNTTLGRPEVYDGSTWTVLGASVAHGSSPSPNVSIPTNTIQQVSLFYIGTGFKEVTFTLDGLFAATATSDPLQAQMSAAVQLSAGEEGASFRAASSATDSMQYNRRHYVRNLRIRSDGWVACDIWNDDGSYSHSLGGRRINWRATR